MMLGRSSAFSTLPAVTLPEPRPFPRPTTAIGARTFFSGIGKQELSSDHDGAAARSSSDIAAALVGMAGSISSPQNQAILREASSALLAGKRELEDAHKREAQSRKIERRLTNVCAAAAESDELKLVADGGEAVTVKASFARASSKYFVVALESRGKEAEEKRFKFGDVGIATLRFVVSGMHAGEACADLVALPTPHDAGVVEQIIDFSTRLLMPWLARAAMRRVIESDDPALLVRLLLAAESRAQQGLEGAGANSLPSLWGELSAAAVPCVARMIERAVAVEAFCGLPLGLVRRILVLVEAPAWCEWQELDVVAKGAGDIFSPNTKDGFCLKATKHAGGGLGALLYVDKDVAAPVVIGEHAYVGIEIEVEAWSRAGAWENQGNGNARAIVRAGWGWGYPEYLALDECKDFLHGGSYRLRFRARRSALHVQCHALLTCMSARLFNEAKALPRLVPRALELLRSVVASEGVDALRMMLLEYMAEAFYFIDREVLGQLSCGDMEAIIKHKALATGSHGELHVLQGVISWAQGSKRLLVSAGAEVRVRGDSNCRKEWRGAECRVVQKVAGGLWEVKRRSDPDGETLWAKEPDLLCPGHVGMERLLQHVRFPFIKLEQIKTGLGKDGLALAQRSPAFLRGVADAMDVQTGKRKALELGERAQKRARYFDHGVIPEFDSGMCAQALMGSFAASS